MAMEPYVIVLARTTREGARYAKYIGLARGRYRVAFSAKNVRRAKRADIHCLDSFWKRTDRHALLAALRYTKGTWFDVTFDPKAEPAPTEEQLAEVRDLLAADSEFQQVVKALANLSGPTERELQVAYRYNCLRDAQHAEWDADLEAKLAAHSDLVDALLPGGSRVDSKVDWNASGDPLDDLEQAAKVVDQGDGMGPQLDIEGGENLVTERKRRYRCRICANLVWNDADPDHDGSVHDARVADMPTPPASPESFFGN